MISFFTSIFFSPKEIEVKWHLLYISEPIAFYVNDQVVRQHLILILMNYSEPQLSFLPMFFLVFVVILHLVLNILYVARECGTRYVF